MSSRNDLAGVFDRKIPVSFQRAHRSHSTVQAPIQLSDLSTITTPFLNYRTSDFIFDLRSCPLERRIKGFKNKFLSAWYAAHERKVFNYDLNCVYKLLDGEYDFSFQLNVERGTLRRKPLRFRHIRQAFDHIRFNFTRLSADELLFHLRCMDRAYTFDQLDLLHLLAINASPLERGHSLIIPSVNKCLPQVLNETGVRIAMDLMLIVEDDTFHIFFNSLLGQASVNHLHLHTLFWPYESGIVNRKCDVLHAKAKVYILRRPDWFIHAFVFQLTGPDDFDDFIRNLSRCAAFLTDENVAHNLFMTRAPPISLIDSKEPSPSSFNAPQLVTAYLFPRRNHTGAKPATNFNPAAVELAGFLTAYTSRFFESATEQTALRIIDEDAVLPESVVEGLIKGLALRYSGELPWKEEKHDKPEISCVGHLLASTNNRAPFRRYSHCYSESAVDTSDEEFAQLGVKNVEALSSNELEELSDSFHTVTLPVPQKNRFSVSSFPSKATIDSQSGSDKKDN